MKNYEVKITPYALEQMVEIRDYIVYQLQNPDAACKSDCGDTDGSNEAKSDAGQVQAG